MLGSTWRKGAAPVPPAASAPAAGFRERLDRDLAAMDQLPSLPGVVSTLLTMLNDPRSSMQDLGQALREDPPLTARVLRLANSPVYGGGARILSVADAIMRMGVLEVQNLIMSVGLLRSLQRGRADLDYRAFWTHWFTVATATEALSRLAPVPGEQDGGAFTVGLLHDIGRFVLAGFYPADAAAVQGERARRRLSLLAAEHRALGMDHAEIGRRLAERWGLPEPIVAGLAHHHQPEQAGPAVRRLPLLVWVAEATCIGAGLGDPDEEPGDVTAGWEALGVDPARAQDVVGAATASAAKSATLLRGA
jgi:HD-like signal output (HDOD) protein